MSIVPRRSNAKPKVCGHVTGDLGILAIRVRERMRNYGPMTLWIADDGCVMVLPEGVKTPIGVPLVGVYDYDGSTADGMAEDIAVTAKEFGQACMRARE